MTLFNISARAAAMLAAGVIGAQAASANVIYQTNGPFGGPFGLIGFDVCSDQSVALRFTPGVNYTLDRINLWFMSNDFSGKTHPQVTVTLRTHDASAGDGGIPSDEILEQWTFNVSAVGWDPRLEQLDSVLHPLLNGDEHYWIVAESEAPCGLDGVWNWAAVDSGFMSICNGTPCDWSPAPEEPGAVGAGAIEGTPVVPGDTNGDGEVDVDDLIAIILAWGACEECDQCLADVNGTCDVDVDDLIMVILNWG